jgi:multidrug resistance efflux pump
MDKKEKDIKSQEADRFTAFQLVRPSGLARTFARWCVGLFLMLVLFTFFPWTQNIRSNGTLTTFNPDQRPQTIHSTIAGRIENWHVQEGQFVARGDTIATLSEIREKFFDPELLVRIDEQITAKEGAMQSTRNKALALENQVEALRAGLRFSLDKAWNKVLQTQLKVQSDSTDLIAARTDYDIVKLQLERQERLYEQGLKSLTEYETRKLKFQEVAAKVISVENRFFTTKNELQNAKIELNSLEAEYLDKISKAQSELNSTQAYYHDTEGEISKMTNEYANMRIRSSFYNITAPQDGYIVQALKSGIGETIKEGEAITSIMAADPKLAVELFVRPMDIPLLDIGQKVRLQFDGWPAIVFSGWPGNSFGTFGGIVAVIDQLGTNGRYRILVVQDPNDDEWPDPLRIGTGAYGWAMLNDVPIWYEIWRQLNGFPPDYFQEDVPGKTGGPNNAKASK